MSSKFADIYKRKSVAVDKRALRGLRRSLDRKQSRNDVVDQRRRVMEATAMSPVTESHSDAAPTKADSQQLVSGPSNSGKLPSHVLRRSLKQW